MNKDAWKEFKGDFNAMTDEEIIEASSQARNNIDFAETWLEAVQSWEAAGKPRDEPHRPYGSCPTCGSPGRSRERRPNGNDMCNLGHIYPSATAV